MTAMHPFLTSKLHRAICTQADLDYVGSLTIDENWMIAANIIEGQQIDVLNINNGERLTTYAIKGPKNSGVICANGAAAHKVSTGDILIIAAYGIMTKQDYNFSQATIIAFSPVPPNDMIKKNNIITFKKIPQYTTISPKTN